MSGSSPVAPLFHPQDPLRNATKSPEREARRSDGRDVDVSLVRGVQRAFRWMRSLSSLSLFRVAFETALVSSHSRNEMKQRKRVRRPGRPDVGGSKKRNEERTLGRGHVDTWTSDVEQGVLVFSKCTSSAICASFWRCSIPWHPVKAVDPKRASRGADRSPSPSSGFDRRRTKACFFSSCSRTERDTSLST